MSKYKKPNNQDNSGGVFGLVEKGLGRIIERIFLRKNQFQVFAAGELNVLWENVENMDPNLSIIEADKLVDTILKRAGVKGESMADRLRHTEKLVPRSVYNDMWESHKVRNRLVHELDHEVNLNNTNEIVFKMKKYLITLGAFNDK